MKNIFLKVTMHAIAWSLLFFAPFFSVYQVVSSVTQSANSIVFIPMIVMGLVMISIFYFNYYILIPRFLLTRRYGIYLLSFLILLALAVVLSGLVFNAAGFQPDDVFLKNPLFKTISPVVRSNTLLMLFVTIIASIAMVLNNRLKQLEEDKLSAQISSLKAQINPHFLFNTLNNIYASAIDTSPRTADMVEKLSEIMRYTMKNTFDDRVRLEDELNYINNYIELQKVRFDSNVKVTLCLLGDPNELHIAPMLLISFIENAFKHGVNSEQQSNILINLAVDQSVFHLLVVNAKVEVQKETSEHSGFGIDNTKKRLQLIYPSKHLLSITETETEFTVSLYITLV